jgi:tripartite-type tricarboxylate transporter receptor subunit TctC
MIISTGGVRLPSLDQNVADWRPRSVEHVPLDSDPLTRGFRTSDRTSEVLCEDVKASIVAVTNKQRGPLLSQVPTVGEAGFAELTVDGLSGFFGPRGMPSSLQEKIAADVKAVADEPELRSRIEALGQQIIGSTPGEFVAAIDEQRGRVEAAARIINLKAAGQ